MDLATNTTKRIIFKFGDNEKSEYILFFVVARIFVCFSKVLIAQKSSNVQKSHFAKFKVQKSLEIVSKGFVNPSLIDFRVGVYPPLSSPPGGVKNFGVRPGRTPKSMVVWD